MDMDPAAKEALERELLRRLDPGGELGELLRFFDSALGRGIWLALGAIAGADVEGLVARTRDLLATTAGSILIFAPLGWAPTERSPSAVYAEACRTYEATHSVDKAEHVLVEGWNSGDWLRIGVMPLQAVGAGDDLLGPVAKERWRLVEKAVRHHEAGAYEASVPIVLAQVDGIARDLDANFFANTAATEAPFLDDRSLLGVPEGLRLLRALFASSMGQSDAKGRLTRHGILHGRELGYDTLINSTKAFVLLNAVVQWALPRGRDRFERQRREREDLYAGAGAVGEDGRQLDRRGFLHIKTWLDDVVAWREREAWGRDGQYFDDPDRAPLPPAPLSEREYAVSTHLEVSGDGREYRAWGVAPSGFCLGIAGRNGEAAVWHYAGARPPSGGTSEDPGWRHVQRDPGHADW
jgi:hypothetical protein